MVAAALAGAAALSLTAAPVSAADSFETTHYHSVKVDGLSVFYREGGNPNAPTLLLLHGFPSSSRMYEPLFTRLASRYHLIAPDYPGFGHSDAPSSKEFAYTFDHIAEVIDDFTTTVGLKNYVLYVQDYGGPVGMRLAVKHPERVRALIIQNAVMHEDGLGPLWKGRRDFWADRAAHEEAIRSAFLSLATTKQRHIGSNPMPETIDPDRWTDEYAFLSRPGEGDIQIDLFYDYRTNVASYPAWDQWLREHHPKTLVVWGKYDPSFQVDEVAAIKRDVPEAETHILDAGHFALYERPDEISRLIENFLQQLPKSP
jgi:pimeloyl-ACP methyl ester carboxylesterase